MPWPERIVIDAEILAGKPVIRGTGLLHGRLQRMWARFFRGHPFVKGDKDVTEADLAQYHIAQPCEVRRAEYRADYRGSRV